MDWDSKIKAAEARVEEAIEEIRRSGLDKFNHKVVPILLNFWLLDIMNWLALLQQVGILAFVDILS